MASPPLKSELYFQRSGYRHLVAAFAVTCTLGIVACAYLPKEEAPIASLQPPPPWAYMIQPQVQLPPDDGIPKRVPDSAVTLTLTQIRDLNVAPDWHSGDHPPMPEVVARGRKPNAFACGTAIIQTGRGARKTPASPV